MSHFSHCHLLASGRKTYGAEETDTELLDDVMEAVLHDTEVVHYPDYVENSETDSPCGSDFEVVPDSDESDDEASRHSSRRVSFIKSLAAELCKVESHSHALYKNFDQSNMDIDARADERHTSCNDANPIISPGDKHASELGLQDDKMSPVKDPCATGSISSDVNLIDDVKTTNVESKVEKTGQLSLPKKREIYHVYTRRKNRLCKPEENKVEDLKRFNNDYNQLSYIESQEPEDLSTALLFVDQYISSNPVPVSYSPVTTVKTKQKSPLSSSVKGTQSLARWSGVRNSENKAEIFEWNDSLDGDGGCIPPVNKGQPRLSSGKIKYNYTYVRRSPSVKSPPFTEQVHKNDVEEDPSRKLYQQTADESTSTKRENTICQDSELFFDVGIGTQIAVEAIQALSSISAGCNEMDAEMCPRKMGEKSNDDTQKQIHAGIWSFPKKPRSAYRGTLGRKNRRGMYCSDSLEDIIQASKQVVKRIGAKFAAAKCVAGRSSSDSAKVKTTKKTKAYRDEDVYIDKENMNGSISGYEAPLCKLNKSRKIKSTRPSSTNLKSSSLFNMREAFDTQCLVVDDYVDILVQKKSDQLENGFNNVGKEGSKCTNRLSDGRNKVVSPECTSVWSTSWGLGDYPRGKRTCRSKLDHSEGHRDLDDSSIKASHEKHNHYSLRCELNEECCSGSSASHSGIKRKRRSTVYISPCLLSSKKYGMDLPMHPTSELKKNASVNENEYAEKRNTWSEKPTYSTITVNASTRDVTGYNFNENLHTIHAAFASCQASTSEKNSPSLVDSYHEQHDKKKPSTPSLTRELYRLGFRESMPDLTSKTSRRRKTMANIRVMLSQNLDESTRKHQKKILTRFGVPITFCPSDATHFITDRFARTQNMLEFIAQGKPVVTQQWLENCDQTGFYIDDKDYIVRDVKKERELGFKLPISLNRARHNPLLKGYRIFITPNVRPGKEILVSLVKAVHGEVVNVVVDSELDNLLVLSCYEDQTYCVPFLQKGSSAYSTELLLNGIIIQKLEFARHRLFTAQ